MSVKEIALIFFKSLLKTVCIVITIIGALTILVLINHHTFDKGVKKGRQQVLSEFKTLPIETRLETCFGMKPCEKVTTTIISISDERGTVISTITDSVNTNIIYSKWTAEDAKRFQNRFPWVK